MPEGFKIETMGTTGVVQNVQEEIKKKMTVKSQTMCFCDTGVTQANKLKICGQSASCHPQQRQNWQHWQRNDFS